MADLFDLDAALRFIKPQKKDLRLRYRADSDLPFAGETDIAGGELLLDTCVYIDQLQDRTPPVIDAVLRARGLNHSVACLAELMHNFGRLDPLHPSTAGALVELGNAVRRIPNHRLHVVSRDVMGQAGALSGVLCRTQGYKNDRHKKALVDCVLYLQALKLGYTVLSRNVTDFDLLLQLLPRGRVLLYRRGD